MPKLYLQNKTLLTQNIVKPIYKKRKESISLETDDFANIYSMTFIVWLRNI